MSDDIAPYTIRWKLTDTAANETVTLPLNPNEMSTPTFLREVQYFMGGGRAAGLDRGPSQPTSWTWSGVILTKAHYDLLLAWAQRGVYLRVEDHLGRMFGIIIESYEPIERLPTPAKPWRATYTMTCLLLEVL